jgi:pimeloyl-ACP methyl ester carboxylesterase
VSGFQAVRLVTRDGVQLAGLHRPRADRSLGIVVAHGFTGSVFTPGTRRIMSRLAAHGGVLGVDFRGHGHSGGYSTVGDAEVLDLQAVVATARRFGYERVATVGFSMGGSVVLRHAALHGGVDAVVSVSSPARWYYRETLAMRRVHWLVESPVGRAVARRLMRTRLAGRWDAVPESPIEIVHRIAPTPLLIVHGDRDGYFPVEHPRALIAASGGSAHLWLVEGMGHAESAMTPGLVSDIGRWIRAAALMPAHGADVV